MLQEPFDFTPARAKGERMADLCISKAERVTDFDAEGASDFILAYLIEHGKTAGEDLVNAATAAGFIAHDTRAFGSVFARLSRVNLIRCVGFCERKKGHGTAGGRIWSAVR